MPQQQTAFFTANAATLIFNYLVTDFERPNNKPRGIYDRAIGQLIFLAADEVAWLNVPVRLGVLSHQPE